MSMHYRLAEKDEDTQLSVSPRSAQQTAGNVAQKNTDAQCSGCGWVGVYQQPLGSGQIPRMTVTARVRARRTPL